MSFYGNLSQPSNSPELPGISPCPLLKVESSLFQGDKVRGQKCRLSHSTSLSPCLCPPVRQVLFIQMVTAVIRRASPPQYLISKQEDLHSGPGPVGVQVVERSKRSSRDFQLHNEGGAIFPF